MIKRDRIVAIAGMTAVVCTLMCCTSCRSAAKRGAKTAAAGAKTTVKTTAKATATGVKTVGGATVGVVKHVVGVDEEKKPAGVER